MMNEIMSIYNVGWNFIYMYMYIYIYIYTNPNSFQIHSIRSGSDCCCLRSTCTLPTNTPTNVH